MHNYKAYTNINVENKYRIKTLLLLSNEFYLHRFGYSLLMFVGFAIMFTSTLGTYRNCSYMKPQTFMGRVMGPLLVRVCPFRKNVIVTCKLFLLLCSLDNFLPKNVIVFLLEN